jgi:EAL domain-containing protein (putative c-di-GMP-specific phosphodiesterase class I)
VLKLDKEFLSNVPGSEKEMNIISSVINMSKKLNLTTVAEGVETAEQVEMLREMGCDIAQGYYYSQPIPLQEFCDRLTECYC